MSERISQRPPNNNARLALVITSVIATQRTAITGLWSRSFALSSFGMKGRIEKNRKK